LARLVVSVLILIILVFVGCQRPESAPSEAIEGEAVQPVEGEQGTQEGYAVTVHEPRARPAPLVGGTGAVYFMLQNGGDAPVTLTGAESPAAGAVEIHTTINDNGVMRMRRLAEGVEIPPDESIILAPGAMHLMLIDLAAPLMEGETVELTLHFEGADDLTFSVPVVNMDDLPAEGEMEHEN
jgi:copper(I)-binding protein